MTIDDDAVLAARARDGDSPAFVELVGRHQDRVFRFVLRMIDSRDDAMDLTQETFMKAWQAMPRWRPEARFGTWLLQIARNGALDLLRRRGVVGFEPLQPDAPFEDRSPGPERQLRIRQRYALLDLALRQIAVEHREVLLLREVEGLSYAEIAVALDIAEGTLAQALTWAAAGNVGLRTGTASGVVVVDCDPGADIAALGLPASEAAATIESGLAGGKSKTRADCPPALAAASWPCFPAALTRQSLVIR